VGTPSDAKLNSSLTFRPQVAKNIMSDQSDVNN
jgi:hypothetical protein